MRCRGTIEAKTGLSLDLTYRLWGVLFAVTEITHLTQEILSGAGYVVVPDVLTPEMAQEMRSQVLELARHCPQEEKRQRVYGLIYQDPQFAALVEHPQVFSLAREILGDSLRLGGFSAHVLHAGASAMGIHVDYPYWAMEPPFPDRPVLEVQAIWMLEDFDEANGAPIFAPGSQTLCDTPDVQRFDRTARSVSGQAGSVVISHGLCWHDTGKNYTTKPRVSLLANYTTKFIQPLEDFRYGCDRHRFDQASPTLKHLLRYDFKPATDPIYPLWD